MTRSEKIHAIHVAYSKVENVLEDTDEELWAYEFLAGALVELQKWFEEFEI